MIKNPTVKGYSITVNIPTAFSFVGVSFRLSTFTLIARVPNPTSITSPILTSYDARAVLPLTETLPPSHASFATVLLFIIRDTFKYLSRRIILISSFGSSDCIKEHRLFFRSLPACSYVSDLSMFIPRVFLFLFPSLFLFYILVLCF